MKRSIGGAIALAAALAATLAGADVKAGVDAWTRGDFALAVTEWRPLAIKGDADAQFNLGQAYKLGRGVPIDPVQAQDWFRRAADQGHLQAQDNYGIGLYQLGRKAEAAPWLERSIARGEPRAQLVLGTMLFNGDGVKTDYPRAYALMTRAAQEGLPSAAQSLAQMEGFITPVDRERGLRLAEGYAAAARVADTGPRPAGPAASVDTRIAPPPAPTGSAQTVPARIAPPIAMASAVPARTAQIPPSRPIEPRPQPSPRPAPIPRAAAPARTGNWRIQLGAFRDRGNAEALWSRVGGRLAGAHPAYVAGGGVTRLQATGFATKAEAQRACTATGGACVIVAP